MCCCCCSCKYWIRFICEFTFYTIEKCLFDLKRSFRFAFGSYAMPFICCRLLSLSFPALPSFFISYVLLVNRKLNCISVVENKWTKIFFLSSFFLFYLFFFFNSNHSPCTSTQTISLFRFYCVRILPEPIDCSFVCSFGLFHRSRYLAIPFVGWMSVSMSEREVCAYPNYISVRVVCILTNQSNFH